MLALTLFFAFALPIIPNDKLTPGRVVAVAEDRVCQAGYSDTVRHTSLKLKRQIYSEYHVNPKVGGPFEIDHRVPLSLSGADVAANLWPQSYWTRPFGAHEKDALEDRIHAAVCHEHSMTLKAGQQIFLGNWIAAYKKWFIDRPGDQHQLRR